MHSYWIYEDRVFDGERYYAIYGVMNGGCLISPIFYKRFDAEQFLKERDRAEIVSQPKRAVAAHDVESSVIEEHLLAVPELSQGEKHVIGRCSEAHL